jgi:hypothetical protein
MASEPHRPDLSWRTVTIRGLSGGCHTFYRVELFPSSDPGNVASAKDHPALHFIPITEHWRNRSGRRTSLLEKARGGVARSAAWIDMVKKTSKLATLE